MSSDVYPDGRRIETFEAPRARYAVVIASYRKLANIPFLAGHYRSDPDCGQVVVAHGAGEFAVEFPGVDNRSDTGGYGAAERFLAADELVRYPVVLFADDDIVPSLDVVARIVDAVEAGAGLAGPYARRCGAQGYRKTPFGIPRAAELLERWSGADFRRPRLDNDLCVLTKLAGAPRDVVALYAQAFPTYAPALAETRGNGEDLTFCAHVRSLGRDVVHVLVPSAEISERLPETSEEGTYSSGAAHWALRDEFCVAGGAPDPDKLRKLYDKWEGGRRSSWW